jgi:hypothetical protein
VTLSRASGVRRLLSDAPAAAAFHLAITLVHLGDARAAIELLRATGAADVARLPRGAWEHAWAEARLALGDLETAHQHAMRARDTGARHGVTCMGGDATRIARRALLARVLLARGLAAQTDLEIEGALADLRASNVDDDLLAAEIEVTYAQLLSGQGHAQRAALALRCARELLERSPSATSARALPIWRGLAALHARMATSSVAVDRREIAEASAHIEARYLAHRGDVTRW